MRSLGITASWDLALVSVEAILEALEETAREKIEGATPERMAKGRRPWMRGRKILVEDIVMGRSERTLKLRGETVSQNWNEFGSKTAESRGTTHQINKSDNRGQGSNQDVQQSTPPGRPPDGGLGSRRDERDEVKKCQEIGSWRVLR